VALSQYGGLVKVESDATGGANSVLVSGAGTVEPPKRILSLSGNMVFGNVVTNTEAFAVLTLMNIGDGPLTVSNIFYPDGFSGNWSGILEAGESRDVTVTFAPVTLALYTGKLMVVSDATGGANRAYISGAGTTSPPSRILILSGNISFGDVSTNTIGIATLSITNAGDSDLTINNIGSPAGFSANWTGIIRAGESQDVPVVFSPEELHSYGGKLIIQSDATGGSNSIYVSGNGTEPSSLSLVATDGVRRYSIHLAGLKAGGGIIQSSSNLLEWLDICTNSVAGKDTILVIERETRAVGQRFYRAIPTD
jgi:hypothetical protein